MRHVISAGDGTAGFNRGMDRLFSTVGIYTYILLDRVVNEGRCARLSSLPSPVELTLPVVITFGMLDLDLWIGA